MTAFIAACAAVGIGGVAIDQSPNSNLSFSSGTTPAIENAALLPQNVSPIDVFWRASLDTRTPAQLEIDLLHSIRKGHLQRVEILLQEPRLDLHKIGIPALHAATQTGSLPMTQKLLDYGVSPRNDETGQSLLNSLDHDISLTFLLLDHGADPGTNKNQAIARAALNGDDIRVMVLSDHTDDVNTHDGKVLSAAIFSENVLTVDAVVMEGGLLTHDHLLNALSFSTPEIVQYILDARAVEVKNPDGSYDHIPLKNVRTAPGFSFDPNRLVPLIDVNADDGTALRMAIIGGDLEKIEIILKAGADPHIADGRPFDLAREKESDEILALLQKYAKTKDTTADSKPPPPFSSFVPML